MKINNNIQKYRLRGKDCDPETTIFYIRSILSKLNIFPIESLWKNEIKNYYSVRLVLNNTNIGVNGKGIDASFALASAYGELMERLQNNFLFQNIDFCEEVKKFEGFGFFPDEVYKDYHEIIKSLPPEFKEIFKPSDGLLYKKYFDMFLSESKYNKKEKLACIKYYNILDGTLIDIPQVFLSYYFGTNGMAAGNTKSEAIIQSISEIFERFAIKKIFLEKIKLPTIPTDFIQKYKIQYDMIQNYENLSQNKIIVKDASIRMNLPVIGIFIINKKIKKYFVKFASHPRFEIALERCLEEALQGRPIDNYFGFSNHEYYTKNKESLIFCNNNFLSVFETGSGVFPNEIFFKDKNKKIYQNPFLNFENNEETRSYYINLIKTLGYNVYIRDNSFLNFPTVHIVIPGMSNVFQFSKSEYYNISLKSEIRKILKTNGFVNKSKNIEIVLNFIELFYKDNGTLDQFIDLPVNKRFRFKNIDLDLFQSMCFYRIGRFKKAYEKIQKYLDKIKTSEDVKKIEYYFCVRDYLAMKGDGLDTRKIREFLKVVHQENIVNEVMLDLHDNKNVFNNFPVYNCWDCYNCPDKNNCYYQSIKAIQIKLKKCMKNNLIDQEEAWKGYFQSS